MKINLHKNATTTPAQRAFIQSETRMNIAQIALKIGVSETTVRRWKKRSFIYDKPNTPGKRTTALTKAQELVVILIRLCLRPGLDDLHQMVQAFILSNCSRSALNRYLKKYEVSRLTPVQNDCPFCLNDYRGSFFYYTKIHIPYFAATQSPVTIQTVLDCSFRWVHADMSFSCRQEPLHFIKEGIDRFPLRCLGIVFSDPIVLCDTNSVDSTPYQSQLIQNYCSVHHLKCHHLKACVKNQTLKNLRQVFGLLQAPGLSFLVREMKSDTSWLMENINVYNNRLCQRTLRHKTPAQALENQYQTFPGSFRSPPKQLVGTLPGRR